MDAKKIVEAHCEKWGYHSVVLKVNDFNGFSVVSCEEYHPVGKNEFFDLIVKDGKVYNVNFDDLEELNKDCFGEED